MWAAMEVLRGKRKPMTAAEIYAEIRERKLARGVARRRDLDHAVARCRSLHTVVAEHVDHVALLAGSPLGRGLVVM